MVRDKEGNSKGYGFVSLLKPLECAKAIREKDQTWLGPVEDRFEPNEVIGKNENSKLQRRNKRKRDI